MQLDALSLKARTFYENADETLRQFCEDQLYRQNFFLESIPTLSRKRSFGDLKKALRILKQLQKGERLKKEQKLVLETESFLLGVTMASLVLKNLGPLAIPLSKILSMKVSQGLAKKILEVDDEDDTPIQKRYPDFLRNGIIEALKNLTEDDIHDALEGSVRSFDLRLAARYAFQKATRRMR